MKLNLHQVTLSKIRQLAVNPITELFLTNSKKSLIVKLSELQQLLNFDAIILGLS